MTALTELLRRDFREDSSKMFEGRSGLLGAVWDLLAVTVELGTSLLVYVLPTRDSSTMEIHQDAPVAEPFVHLLFQAGLGRVGPG